jgi:hypothetical protein
LPRQRAVFTAAAEIRNGLLRRLLESFAALQSDASVSELARLVETATDEEIYTAINARGIEATVTNLADELGRGAMLGAKTAAGELGQVVVLDMGRPLISSWLRTHAAELVRETTGTSLAAVRAIVKDGIERGRHPTRLARDVKSAIGLTEPQARAVTRRRDGLLASGVDAEKANGIADRYAEKCLKRRALTIAQNESMIAINQGRRGLWDQLIDEGALPAAQEQEVLAAGDGAVCEAICEPMDRQRRKVGEPFETPAGQKVAAPPFHVRCRCTVAMVLGGRS